MQKGLAKNKKGEIMNILGFILQTIVLGIIGTIVIILLSLGLATLFDILAERRNRK